MRPDNHTGSSLSLKWVPMGIPEAHALPSSLQPPSPLILISIIQGSDLRATVLPSVTSSFFGAYEYPIFASTLEINLVVSLVHCLLLLSCPLVSVFISRFPDPACHPCWSLNSNSAIGLDIIMPSLWCRKLASCTGSFYIPSFPSLLHPLHQEGPEKKSLFFLRWCNQA